MSYSNYPNLLCQCCTGLHQIGFVFDRLEAAWDQSLEELRLAAEAYSSYSITVI